MLARRIKILTFLIVFTLVSIFTLIYKVKCDSDGKRLYSQGMEFLKKEDYSNAYYNFKNIKPFSNKYKLALLKQYKCALNLEDKRTAQKILLALIKEVKNPQLRPYFLYNEALISQNNNTDTKKTQLKKFTYIYENYPESDFKYASAYKIAKLIKDRDKTEAKTKFIEYLEFAPQGKFVLDSIEELETLKQYLTKSDYEILASACLLNGKYSKALQYYLKTSFNKNWVKIADCYRNLDNRSAEKDTILRGFSLIHSEATEKEISAKIERLSSISGLSKVELLNSLYVKYEDSYIFPTVAYRLAQVSSSAVRSYKLYELIGTAYSDSIWAPNALWEVFWHNYKLGRYQVCLEIAQKHLTLYKDTPDTPRILYWQGVCYLKEKKNSKAKESFYKITDDYPLNYYAFLATRKLKSSKIHKMIMKKPIVAYEINNINKSLFEDNLLLELANNDDFDLIDEFKINDEYVKAWILNKKRNFPVSINKAKAKFNHEAEDSDTSQDGIEKKDDKKSIKTDYRLKLIYPVEYDSTINEIAHELKQSPYLFLGLVREESHFNKTAKSSVGAIGLSQVMPQTASFIEKRQVSTNELYNEKENIKIGLNYFKYLVDFFKGDELLAILAYNAGPGNVNKWLNSSEILSGDIDELTEDIPYIETKNYIKKVISSYWAYLNIYK